MLDHNKFDDIPSISDLDQIATDIRAKIAKQNSVSQTTPRSSRRKSDTPLFPSRQAAPTVNIDDFFAYFDDTPMPESLPPTAAKDNDGDPQDAPHRSPLKAATLITPGQPEQTAAAEGSLVRPRQLSNDLIVTDEKLPCDDVVDEAYAQRAGSGRVEASYEGSASVSAPVLNIDDDVDMSSSRSAGVSPRIALNLDNEFWINTRYMNDGLGERVQNLRARVKKLGRAILDRMAVVNGLQEPPQCSMNMFTMASPNPEYAYGRVIVEPEYPGGISVGRLNDKSVALESPDGRIVRLNLSRLMEGERPVFLNPGMVIVVYGVNTNDREIDVHAIYDNCLPAIRDAVKKDAMDDEPESDHKFVDVITAAGPYTTASNLKYEPLDDLLRVVERSKPALVVLAGPFVDARHSLISETLTVPFEQVFLTRVLSRISDCLKRLREEDHECEFVLVPSVEDAHQSFVCPQPPMAWPKNTPDAMEVGITLTSNPTLITLTTEDNYCATIGATSLSTVSDISSDNVCLNMDKFQGISSHLVKQQSFYPMFPPTDNIPFDSTLMQALDIPDDMESGPSVDLLLVPARLKGFVKIAEAGTIVVNSGLLCRGAGGGTFAEIRLPLHRRGRPRAADLNEKYADVKVVRL